MGRIAVAAASLAAGAHALRPVLPARPLRARGRVATKMVIDPSHAHDLMTAHVGHDWGSTFQMAAIQGRTCVDDTGWWCTTVRKSKFYGAFVIVASTSTPSTDACSMAWRAPDALVDLHTGARSRTASRV